MNPWWLLSTATFVGFLVAFFALAYRMGMADGFREGYRRAWKRRGEVFPDDDGSDERPEVPS